MNNTRYTWGDTDRRDPTPVLDGLQVIVCQLDDRARAADSPAIAATYRAAIELLLGASATYRAAVELLEVADRLADAA